jgi:GntR family transcriptional regulator, transcriptional repressor for pyruvate dehydrogenase complex
VIEKSKGKVYQEVLEQIRLFIDQHDLSPGDRLPSERDLAETLNAGRSSVREALRAIELLGLIETRQGEGTFLKSYQPYHSVELLASFILRETKTRNELIELKKLLEQQGAKYVIGSIDENHKIELEKLLNTKIASDDKHYRFFLKLFELTNNKLLLKVWQLVEEFTRSIHTIKYDTIIYGLLLDALCQAERNRVEDLIEQLYGISLS